MSPHIQADKCCCHCD